MFEKWRAIGTHQFHFFSEQNAVLFTLSATYYVADGEKRKIEFDKGVIYGMQRWIFHPKNHPLYHSFMVPFLRKTGDFDVPNAEAEKMVRMFCSRMLPARAGKIFKGIEEDGIKEVSDKAGSNVLPFLPDEPKKDS
jgi:hypothetical protein